MNMNKIIEWIKSLFKRKETVCAGECTVKTTLVEEAQLESASVTVEPKSVVKKYKKRGRPRKKKVEQK